MESTLSDSAMQAGVTVDITRKLETLLNRMGATGKGLHEKVTSIDRRLPGALQRKLRFVASVRNNLSHNDVVLPKAEFDSFVRAAQDALSELQAIADAPAQVTRRTAVPPSNGAQQRRGLPLGLLLVAVAMAVFLFSQFRGAKQQPEASGATQAAGTSGPVEQPGQGLNTVDTSGASTSAPGAAEPQVASQSEASTASPGAVPRSTPRKHATPHRDANPANHAHTDGSHQADARDATADSSAGNPGASRIPLNTVRNITQGL